MALTNSYTTEDGIVHENAYARIIAINTNANNKHAHIDLAVFHDKATSDKFKNKVSVPILFTKAYEIHKEASPEVTKEVDGQTVVVSQRIPSYDELFGTDVLDVAGMNEYKSAYEWLQSGEFVNWETI